MSWGGGLTLSSSNILYWQESETTWRIQDTNVSKSSLEPAASVNFLHIKNWNNNGISLAVSQIYFEGKLPHLYKIALNYLEKQCCVIFIKNFDST